MVGKGKLLDTDKYFVICANMLCSSYGSSGPASLKPDGKPYLFDFPNITIRDIVHAQILLRQHLGIGQVDLLIGASIGGFQAVEWAVTEPKVIRKAAIIATAARISPWLTAWEETQRMTLEADPTFRTPPPEDPLSGGRAGLRAARAIALISYRSYEGYCLTQGEKDPDTLYARRACTYQQHQGDKLAGRFDAYSYYYLSVALDSHNIGRGRGGLDAALGRIEAQCVFIGIDSDRLFPLQEQKYMAERVRGSRFHSISSAFGHDGFLLEYKQLADIFNSTLL